MKVIGFATLTGAAYAGICSQRCVDTNPNCAESDQHLDNYDVAGFEDVAECEAHACSVTFPNSSAEWHACEEGSRLLEERKYNHIVKMAKSQMNTKYSLRQIFKMLQNYGCHCFPGQTRAAGGHGPAVDEQDSLCKDLARCHRCVEMDHGADQIDVNDDKYRFNVVNGAISCARNTEKGWHQSKRDLCECDAAFANAIGAMWNDDNFNEYYWQNPKDMKLINKGKAPNDKFDMVGTCQVIGGGKADSCCGSYPARFPYESSEKQCCQSTEAYNPVTQECCDNGMVASPGDC